MVALAGKKIKDKKNIIKDRLMGKRFKPKPRPKPGGRTPPRLKPKPKPKPGDRTPPRLKPKPLPKPGDRTPQGILRRIGKGKRKPKMLPPKRPRGTAPRLPSMKDLTPEQRKKVLQLIRGMRRT